MKIAKINGPVNNHVLRVVVRNGVKRITKAFQIWRIDCQYRALGDYVDDLKANQIDVEKKRRELLMKRSDLRVEMLEVGGN
ncbi:hypothetical protein [Undibacterium aquatile]|uniref:Phage protein n=1 Tax=Undibacterium aquatile TaxID=1537398 RepID=A0ABR6XJY1_9BURK|nr:hypothetical protein [Undibacterium aquatile]MBC3813073.1 hypothetical protein [Undibacterium aquatile]